MSIFVKQALSKVRKKTLLPLLSAAFLRANTPTDKEITYADIELSLEQLCLLYPIRVTRLLNGLDLEQDGLRQVQAAFAKNDLLTACETLVAYYQDGGTTTWLRKSDLSPSNARIEFGDLVLQNSLTFQSVRGTVPQNHNAQLDWIYKGPHADREWAWFLNRHYHLLDLFAAYQETGNPIYIRYLNQQVIDWVLSSPSKRSPTVWAQWRGLEVAFRMRHWSSLFYGLQQVAAFTPTARILMLSSLLDHAHYLRTSYSWGANWLVTEMTGLATLGCCWPEFKRAPHWVTYASRRLLQELQQQLYPDGVQKELTSHYHREVLQGYQTYADLMDVSGRPVSDTLRSNLESMWNYLAYSLRPDGHGTLNNDSDRDDNRALVIQAAKTYHRADWTYIATNGKAGQPPQDSPSTVFPWAGQIVMRSGWDAHAHWAFFDMGPLGIYYHIHTDKLHLSISAYGRDLLVDSGRYSYVRSKFWHYFRGAASHNVILVEGQGQQADTREAQQPVGGYALEPEFDFARGTFDRGFTNVKGTAIHKRAIVYLRHQYWIVIDQITTDRPRHIEPLWHFHPDCRVAIEGESVVSNNADAGNLRIIPDPTLSWTVNLVQGQEAPVQGWWSEKYNHKVPNPTAIYSTQIEQSALFAWMLLPAYGRVPHPTMERLSAPEGAIRLGIKLPDQPQDIIAVRISGDAIIDLGSGLNLEGDCAILRTHQPPLLCNGVIKDADSTVIYEHKRSAKD